MPSPHSKELAPTRLDSRRPFISGYELFWSRVPIVLVPSLCLMICCALVSPAWSIFVGGVVVLVLLAVATAEFLVY